MAFHSLRFTDGDGSPTGDRTASGGLNLPQKSCVVEVEQDDGEETSSEETSSEETSSEEKSKGKKKKTRKEPNKKRK